MKVVIILLVEMAFGHSERIVMMVIQLRGMVAQIVK